jgi:uncharacterized protein
MTQTLLNIIKQQEKIVLDTGIWISYLHNEDKTLKEILEKSIFSEESDTIVVGNSLLLSEIYYIICRSQGVEKSTEVMNDLISILILSENYALVELAGRIKCRYSISLADCYSIATGILYECPVLFKQEGELTSAIISSLDAQFHITILTY